jgi:ATP-binding protein involved in chromosome partitioning
MDEATIRERLREIEDPDLGDDIVSLGLVNEITVDEDSIELSLGLGAPYSPTETEIADRVRDAIGSVDRDVTLSAEVDEQVDAEDQVLPNASNIIPVASGKGGVGKSTVAVNVAAGLADRGARVGLFDADVYGPNVPRMVGSEDPPGITDDEQLIPPEAHGMKLMSMAYLAGEEDPVIWRGPMVHKVLTQLWEDVEWGYLDYLIIDLPPGTGDTQLTLLQSLPITGAVIVTTPQDVALDDARKGLEMFGKHETPVLGIVENMSTFVCPDCGGEHDIFDSGGGETFADTHEMPYLGAVPLDPQIRMGGDEGEPLVLEGDSETGTALREVAARVSDNAGIIRRRYHSRT